MHPRGLDRMLLFIVGGEGGIRTHVPLTGQDAFEAPPLRPLRYLSVPVRQTLNYTVSVSWRRIITTRSTWL